jgi:hypothetical protein
MRHFAIHDHRGTIATLIAGPSDAPPMVRVVEPGYEVTEVNLAESGLDPSSFDTEEAVIKALGEVRVDVRREGRLVRRSDEPAA